jgi:ABC-type nitrate/sulfonate/bicarbonate transport system permease component
MSFRRMAAIVVTTLLGSTIGLLVGFFNSGLVGVSLGFWYWISYPLDSWHWPILGLLGQRFHGLNHIRLLRRACRTKCG